MDEWLDQLWDTRYWEIALKSDHSIDAYRELKSSIVEATESARIDELPQQEQDWMRATR
jgi:hypothetical protein